jgi:hypothetical protein
MSKSIRPIAAILLLLAVVSMACLNTGKAAPTGSPSFELRPSDTAGPNTPPTDTLLVITATLPDTPAPTETQPAPSATPAQPTATVLASLPVADGVSLVLPKGLAKDVRSDITAPVTALPDAPFWIAQPASLYLLLNGYPLTDNYHKPVIQIFPLAEFAQVNEGAKTQIAALQDLLAKKPQTVDRAPFVPLFNAGQVLHTALKYIDFQNGSGVRYMTQYDQAVDPINNQELFYTFQGITSDGSYYISVILPISDPNLPKDAQMTNAEMDKISKDYNQYIQDTIKLLDGETPDSFTPNQASLDALVASLKVTPNLLNLTSASINPTGLWTPVNNVPGPTSAMALPDVDATMKEMVDLRSDQITFKGQTCPISGYTIETKDAADYFTTQYKMSADPLVNGYKTVEVIHTSCTIPGFAEFVRTPMDSLIINLDGVFFILDR